jgi:hypothetical protein
MKEAFSKLITGLSFIEAIMAIGVVVGCVVVLLITIAFTLDKLNVKTFSFTKGFTFYQDEEPRKSRVTRKPKTVKRTVKK